MALKHIGNAVFVDPDPIGHSEAGGKEWSPRLKDLLAYAYVEFPSLERGYWGIFLSRGGPEGKWEEQERVGDTLFQGIAPYGQVEDAIKEASETYLFEEVPFVEVTTKEDYDRAVIAQLGENPDDPRTWKLMSQQGAVKDGDWEGPGLYDFRDRPPGKFSDSVEKYELESMEVEAEDLLDYMYQGDEWKSVLRELLADAA